MLKNKSKNLHLPIRDLSWNLPHLANLVNKSLLTNCILYRNLTNTNFKADRCSKTAFSYLAPLLKTLFAYFFAKDPHMRGPVNKSSVGQLVDTGCVGVMMLLKFMAHCWVSCWEPTTETLTKLSSIYCWDEHDLDLHSS